MTFPDDAYGRLALKNDVHTGFAFMPIDMVLFDSLQSKRLNICATMGKNHRLAGRGKISVHELRNERLIVFSGLRFQADICDHYGIKPGIILNSPDKLFLDELLGTGQTLLLGVEAPALQQPECVTVGIEDLDMYLEYHLIARKNVFLSEAEEQFISYARERFF
jgi:hypothetical protein